MEIRPDPKSLLHESYRKGSDSQIVTDAKLQLLKIELQAEIQHLRDEFMLKESERDIREAFVRFSRSVRWLMIVFAVAMTIVFLLVERFV